MSHHIAAQSAKHPLLLSYNARLPAGRNNRDSVLRALERLGITQFDTIDRDRIAALPMNYTPWCTIIWASGDPAVPVMSGEATGQSGLSAKETREIEQFLSAGHMDSKKSFIIAGQNIAYQHQVAKQTGKEMDTTFLESWLQTEFVANSPVDGIDSGELMGGYRDYWKFDDQLHSLSPDVVRPWQASLHTGPEAESYAYSYTAHPQTPLDSSAGVAYYNPTYNTVFLAFDWADPIQTNPGEAGVLTSGTTRVLKGALDFVTGTGGWQCKADLVSELTEEQEVVWNTLSSDRGEDFISFTLPKKAIVSLQLLDVIGKIVRTVIPSQLREAGAVEQICDLRGLSSGHYFYELTVTDEQGKCVRLSRSVTNMK